MKAAGIFISFLLLHIFVQCVYSQPEPQSDQPSPAPSSNSEPEPIPSVPPTPEPTPEPTPVPTPTPTPGMPPQPVGPQPSPAPSNGTPAPNPMPGPYQQIYDDVDLGLKVALILVGLIWLIFGLKLDLMKPHLTLLLAGFIILYFVAYQLLFRFTVTPQKIDQWLAYALAAVAGLIGAVLFFLSKPVGRFFFCVMSGILFTALLWTYTPLGAVDLAPEYRLATIFGVGVLIGLVGIFSHLYIPLIVSSFNGAFLICNAIDSLSGFSTEANLLIEISQAGSINIPYTPLELGNWHIYVVLGAIIVITIIGIIVQCKFTASGEIDIEKRKKQGEEFERDPETSPLLYN